MSRELLQRVRDWIVRDDECPPSDEMLADIDAYLSLPAPASAEPSLEEKDDPWSYEQGRKIAERAAPSPAPAEPVACRYRYTPEAKWRLADLPTAEDLIDPAEAEVQMLYAAPTSAVGAEPVGHTLQLTDGTTRLIWREGKFLPGLSEVYAAPTPEVEQPSSKAESAPDERAKRIAELEQCIRHHNRWIDEILEGTQWVSIQDFLHANPRPALTLATTEHNLDVEFQRAELAEAKARQSAPEVEQRVRSYQSLPWVGEFLNRRTAVCNAMRAEIKQLRGVDERAERIADVLQAWCNQLEIPDEVRLAGEGK